MPPYKEPRRYLAHGEGHLSGGGPAPTEADLEQCTADARRVLAHVHHVRSQREALHPRPRHIRLHIDTQQPTLKTVRQEGLWHKEDF